MARSQLHRAIVLKRFNYGETDRIVTLYSDVAGKIAVIAKGSRKINSSRVGSLEPGMIINAYLIITKGMPLLTQARVIHNLPHVRTSLAHIKRLSQVLEILDQLTVEEPNTEVFNYTHHMLQAMDQGELSLSKIRHSLSVLIEMLGFQKLSDTSYDNISDYVSSISDRPLKSFSFLTIKQTK